MAISQGGGRCLDTLWAPPLIPHPSSCVAGGHAWKGCVIQYDGACVTGVCVVEWQGSCMMGRACKRQRLKRAVRILLGCILVNFKITSAECQVCFIGVFLLFRSSYHSIFFYFILFLFCMFVSLSNEGSVFICVCPSVIPGGRYTTCIMG